LIATQPVNFSSQNQEPHYHFNVWWSLITTSGLSGLWSRLDNNFQNHHCMIRRNAHHSGSNQLLLDKLVVSSKMTNRNRGNKNDQVKRDLRNHPKSLKNCWTPFFIIQQSENDTKRMHHITLVLVIQNWN
jgi:hypothetical protein